MSETNAFRAGRGFTRRQTLASLLPAAAALALIGRGRAAEPSDDLTSALEALAQREGGRLGVCVFDTGTGSKRGVGQGDLFALCSTFKFVLAGAILQRVDAGSMSLDRAVAVAKEDILGNSPVTEKNVGRTMSVGELCHAAMTESDNAAANLLLKTIDGPESVMAFLSGIGDATTRLDRNEPGMNNPDIASGDTRDTTSPEAMAATMQAIVLGDVLSPASREIITGWLKASQTGKTRLRAGLPADWIVGDKTGTGSQGQTNDIAVTWPPGRAPVIVTVYYVRKGRTMQDNAKIIAEVGRIVGRAA